MSEINRKIANLIKQGNIYSCNAAQGLVQVQIGELISDWLPYFVPFAGAVAVHRPPSVGENCIVLSPSGELANGLVLCGLASTQCPQPSQSENETVIKYPDGAIIKYQHDSSHLDVSGIQTAKVQAASEVTVDCPQTTFTCLLYTSPSPRD